MPIGQEVDNGIDRRWELQFTHTPTGVRVGCYLLLGGAATEAQRDAVFQGLVDKLATLANTTIDTAKKFTMYDANVTPTP